MTNDPSVDPDAADEPAVTEDSAHRPDGVIEPWARPWGALVTGAMTLGLIGLAGFYLYELSIGASDSPIRVVMSMLLFLVFAAAGAAMTRAWLHGAPWTTTLTLVIGVLLLPTTWSLFQAEQLILGVVIGVLAVSAVYIGWKGRPAAQ